MNNDKNKDKKFYWEILKSWLESDFEIFFSKIKDQSDLKIMLERIESISHKEFLKYHNNDSRDCLPRTIYKIYAEALREAFATGWAMIITDNPIEETISAIKEVMYLKDFELFCKLIDEDLK